jgi:glutathione synthase/RimK-type ligase-like ATP-grasp enzyme
VDHTLGRQLASKWVKTKVLLASPSIAPHIPPTRLFSEVGLRIMLARHGMVVLKPVRGSGGLGVMKVTQEVRRYSYTYMFRTRTFTSFPDLWKAVNRVRRRRPYLIQKGIELATVGSRPIDYRVKYVKTNGKWIFRAMVGRIARRGLFVTNLCRGGTLISGSGGLKRSLSPEHAHIKKREMRELTKTSTRLLENCFPGIGQLGYDYGIDRNGHIWILEVNTRPQ